MKTQLGKIFYLLVLGFSTLLTHLIFANEAKTSLSPTPPHSGKELSEKDFLEELKKQGFYSLYTDYLIKVKKVNPEESQWSLQTIRNADALTKAARPDRVFYNNSILWYGKGTSKIGFRPVDTPTDCNSGCTPVVFHLVIDAFGSTLALLEEEEPLRKKYHVPFTKEDKKKLLTLCKELPEALSIVEHPLELTEPASKQTWTFFQDVLIKDGAYTSFVVYNTARVTKDFVGLKPTVSKTEEAERKKLTEIFQKPVNDEKELKELLDKLVAFLGTAKHIKVRQVLLDNNLKAFYYLILGEETSKDLPKMIEKYINPFAKEYSTSRQAFFLTFLKNLLKEEKGRKLLVTLESQFKGWKDLHKGTVSFLPFLAAGLSEDEAYLKKKNASISKTEILAFSSSESFFLSSLAKAYLKLKDKEGTLLSYARYLIRYPKAEKIKDFKLPPSWEKELAIYKNKELHAYSAELTKEFYPLDTGLPPVSGYLPYNKDKEKTIPEQKDGKQLYVFFAPWCAHCHSLLKTLAETMPESFWKKTQLICSFSGDKKQLDQFLDLADFKKKAPLAYSEIIMLREDDKTKSYYSKKLDMHAVPKIILTNKNGSIVDFSFDIEPESGKDLNRDLEIIFSNI